MGYAEKLKRQLKDRRDAEPLVDVKLPVPELGPDFIFEFKARRVDLSQLIMTGQIPEDLAVKLLNIQKQSETQPNGQDVAASAALAMSPEDQLRFIRLQKMVVQQVSADPVFVERIDVLPGEVSLFDLPGPLLTAIYMYAMSLSPDVPVEMTNGEAVSVADVASFRPAE